MISVCLITGKVNLNYLIQAVSARFLHSKFITFPFLQSVP